MKDETSSPSNSDTPDTETRKDVIKLFEFIADKISDEIVSKDEAWKSTFYSLPLEEQKKIQKNLFEKYRSDPRYYLIFPCGKSYKSRKLLYPECEELWWKIKSGTIDFKLMPTGELQNLIKIARIEGSSYLSLLESEYRSRISVNNSNGNGVENDILQGFTRQNENNFRINNHNKLNLLNILSWIFFIPLSVAAFELFNIISPYILSVYFSIVEAHFSYVSEDPEKFFIEASTLITLWGAFLFSLAVAYLTSPKQNLGIFIFSIFSTIAFGFLAISCFIYIYIGIAALSAFSVIYTLSLFIFIILTWIAFLYSYKNWDCDKELRFKPLIVASFAIIGIPLSLSSSTFVLFLSVYPLISLIDTFFSTGITASIFLKFSLIFSTYALVLVFIFFILVALYTLFEVILKRR